MQVVLVFLCFKPDTFLAFSFLSILIISEHLTLAYKLKSSSQIESAAICPKVQEGDATMLIQGSVAWTKK